MTGSRGLLTNAKNYYQERRKTYRPVFQLGSSNLHATVGQVASTTAGFFTAFMVSAPVPWGLAGLTAGGLAVGSYFFPKPIVSNFTANTEAELAAMTRPELLAYAQRLRDQEMSDSYDRRQHPDMPSTIPFDILRRQAKAAKIAQDQSPTLAGALEMPLADLQTWTDASYRHQDAVKRWSQYELDPEKQIRFPAMSDTREAPTAAMIRAMKQAREASESSNAQDYAAAVSHLTDALDTAEEHARNNEVRTTQQQANEGRTE